MARAQVGGWRLPDRRDQVLFKGYALVARLNRLAKTDQPVAVSPAPARG